MKRGDTVLLGAGFVHWVIVDIDLQLGEARLRSGMTGRFRYDVPIAKLRPFEGVAA